MSGVNQRTLSALNEVQKFWYDHLLRQIEAGGTIKEYAERHGLRLSSCYDWRSRFRKMGLLPSAKKRSAQSNFKRVGGEAPSLAPPPKTDMGENAAGDGHHNDPTVGEYAEDQSLVQQSPLSNSRIQLVARIHLPNGVQLEIGGLQRQAEIGDLLRQAALLS